MTSELAPLIERPCATPRRPTGILQRRCACQQERTAGENTPASWSSEPTSDIPVSRPDDTYESEADRIADAVMTVGPDETHCRPALTCASPQVSRCENVEPPALADPAFVRAADAPAVANPSGGAPLPHDVRSFMEPRFGADLSDVRVYSGDEAGKLTNGLQAQAFTFGRHIWLGHGESVRDRRLMAHELTHVLQQVPRPTSRPDVETSPTPAHAQRARKYYMLPRLGRGIAGPGTRTHQYVLGILGGATSGLFGEVKIPGANRKTVGLTLTGIADLYKASKTIGVRFEQGEGELVPAYLDADADLSFQGKKMGGRAHLKSAAPIGSKLKGEGGAPVPGIERLGTAAPTDVAMGELKAAYEGETALGGAQVKNYVSGVTNTAAEVDRFAAAHPDRVRPKGESWGLKKAAVLEDKEVTIPAKYKTPSASTPQIDASLYVDETETRIREMCVPVIRFHRDGVWTYDFVPASRLGVGRPSAPGGATKRLNTVLDGIKITVIPPMKRGPRGGMRKRRTVAVTAVHAAPRRRVLRRAKDDFRYENWHDTVFKPWSKKAEELTGGRGSGALRRPGKDAEAILMEAAVAEIGQRNNLQVKAAAGAAAEGRHLETVQHWVDHGATYGRLRQVFGSAFIKVVDFYERARDRLQRAVRSLKGSMRGGGGSLATTVVRAIMSMVASFGRVILGKVAERLVDAVQRGAQTLLEERFGGLAQGVQEEIERVQEQIAGLQRTVSGAIDAVVERLLKPYEAEIEIIRDAAKKMREIATWADRIKWAWRVASCVAPPALGCLIGLIGSTIAEKVMTKIAASCWFQRGVLFPIIKEVEFVQKLPGRIAEFIASHIRDLLPTPFRGIIGEVDKSPLSFNKNDAECDDNVKVSPDHEAIMDLYSLYGEAKVDALLAALEHRGASDDLPVTAAELADVHTLLMTHTAEEIADIIRSSPRVDGKTMNMGQVVDDLEDGLSSGTWSGPSATGAAGTGAGVADDAGGGGGAGGGTGLTPAEQEAESRSVAARIAKNKKHVRRDEGFVMLGPEKLKAGQQRSAFIVERDRRGGGFFGGHMTVTIRQPLPDGTWMVRYHAGARFYHETGQFFFQLARPLNRPFKLYTDGGGPRRKATP